MNADWLAPFYQGIEYLAFGRALEHCRFFPHSDLPLASGQVLILGEGDGRFLARFLRRHPVVQVDVIDLSAKMLLLAENRISPMDRARVRFLRADATEWSSGGKHYDLIVTQFFFDCLSAGQTRQLIPRLATALTPRGSWIVAEFQQPASGFGRFHAGIWLWAMYRFFRITTGLKIRAIPAYEGLLESAGLSIVGERHWRWGLIVSQLWSQSYVPSTNHLPELIS